MLGSTIVLDACVLYPAPLRDLLMHLALVDLYRARWTEEIHSEWMRNVLVARPDLTAEQLGRTRSLMNLHIRDCLVEDYEDLIDSLSLPDKNDRHVLAAAIQCRADFILTYNLKDFPIKNLKKFGIAPLHPDDLVLGLIDADEKAVTIAVNRHFESLKKPRISIDHFVSIMRNQRLVRSSDRLRALVEKKR